MDGKEYLERMLDQLISESVFAHAHLEFLNKWRAFGRDHESTWDRYNYFFGLTHQAHLDALRVRLHRLTDSSKGAVSLRRLLIYGRDHPGLFTPSNTRESTQTLDEIDGSLQSLEPLLQKVKKLRDKHFTHLSQEHLSAGYDVLYKTNALTFNDLSQVVENLGDQLNKLSGLFRDSTTLMGFRPSDEKQVELCLSLLEEIVDAKREETRKITARLRGGSVPSGPINWPKY